MDFKKIFDTASGVFKTAYRFYSSQQSVPAPAPPAEVEHVVVAHQEAGPLPRADMDLSPHFGLYELTKTNNAALQQKNRILTDVQVIKLRSVAALMEQVRTIVGCTIEAHSGYRCPDLNSATTGSAKKSQHMLCEACDWTPVGPNTEDLVEAAFQKLASAARNGQIKFGQLIVERAQRNYTKSVWIHISLGKPYRDPMRCGEIMRMVEQNGQQVYTLIERISQ